VRTSVLAVIALSGLHCASARQVVAPDAWQSPLGQDHSLVGRIYDVARGQFVTETELRTRAIEARFVLLGETHDNPDHHRLQARAVRWLAEAGRRPHVVVEMIEESRQQDVEDQRARAPSDPDALALRLDWARSGWPDWAMYRPVFAATMEAEFPLIASMLPRDRAMSVARGTETLPAALVERHQLGQPLPEDLEAALIEELRDGHCGHLPDDMLKPMLEIQRARDALMADKLLAAPADGAILIAGAGHTRSDRAVPWYLRRLNAPLSLSIGFVEIEDGENDPTAYASRYGATALPFDLVWFTPRANDIDHCAEMEKMMKRHKSSP
jgi:uncharacterized iron-regulated protein